MGGVEPLRLDSSDTTSVGCCWRRRSRGRIERSGRDVGLGLTGRGMTGVRLAYVIGRALAGRALTGLNSTGYVRLAMG
jgi:hypothetical protein